MTSELVCVPILAQGAMRVQWGLHWVKRLVEIRANGLLRITSPATSEEWDRLSQVNGTSLHLSNMRSTIDEMESKELDSLIKSEDPAPEPRGGDSSDEGGNNEGEDGGAAGLFASAVRDISFLRSMTTGVSEYFVDVAELTLASHSAPGPPFQLVVSGMKTCDADSRVTDSVTTRRFSFVSQKHRMQWVDILESTGARLLSIRPPLEPVVTHRTSVSIALEWHNWRSGQESSAQSTEMFEVQYRKVQLQHRGRTSHDDNSEAGGGNKSNATNTSKQHCNAPLSRDSADNPYQSGSAEDETDTSTLPHSVSHVAVTTAGGGGRARRKGGLLAAVARQSTRAAADAAEDKLPVEVPYEEEEWEGGHVTEIGYSANYALSVAVGSKMSIDHKKHSINSENVVDLVVVRGWKLFSAKGSKGGTATNPIKKCGGTGVGTSTVLEGLRPDTLYQFRVRQKGHDGTPQRVRGWSFWGPPSEVVGTLSSREQRLRDNEQRIQDFFCGKLQPYKAVFRGESAYTKTMRVLNFSVNAAYQMGVPYGTFAYWGWRALGLGQVVAQQSESIGAIVKNVFSTYRRLRSQDPELSARVGTTDLSLGVYYHLHMQHAIRGTFPDLLDSLHRRCSSKPAEDASASAQRQSSSTVKPNVHDEGETAHADAGSCCGVYREDCDLDASALRDYTDAFPYAKAAYFPHEEEIQWNVQQFGFDAVVAHSQSATDPLPSYCVLANTSERRAVFAFRGTTDFADLSICSDANILPLYDDPDWDSQVQADGACDECGATAESDAVNAKGESAGAGASRHLKKIQWKCRPFGRSKVHRGIRDAVLWLIHQEGLLKYASKFADAGYEILFTGHSLGAACAVLLGMFFLTEGYSPKVFKIRGFALPAFVCPWTARRIRSLGIDLKSFCVDTDFVCHATHFGWRNLMASLVRYRRWWTAMTEYDQERLGPGMLEKLGVIQPTQRARSDQDEDSGDVSETDGAGLLAAVDDAVRGGSGAAPAAARTAKKTNALAAGNKGQAKVASAPASESPKVSKFQSFVNSMTPAWIHRLQHNTELASKRGVHDPLVKEIVVAGDAVNNVPRSQSTKVGEGVQVAQAGLTGRSRSDSGIEALLGPVPGQQAGGEKTTIASSQQTSRQKIQCIRKEIQALLEAHEPFFVPTAKRMTNEVEIRALHTELSYTYRAPPLHGTSDTGITQGDSRRTTVIPGLILHAYRYHGSFRVAEVDGGFVGFNRIQLSKKMFVDHMTSTISDVIRTLFRLRQFRSGLSFESDAATNLDRGAIRNAPKSLRPPPRFQSWKNVVNCSVCGNDVAWREAMMGGRAAQVQEASDKFAFSVSKARCAHNCRCCGEVVCKPCSEQKTITSPYQVREERTCSRCFLAQHRIEFGFSAPPRAGAATLPDTKQ